MNQAATIDDRAPLDVVGLFAFTGVCAVVSLIVAAFTPDPAFRIHGYIGLAGSLAALAAMTFGVTSKASCAPTRAATPTASSAPG